MTPTSTFGTNPNTEWPFGGPPRPMRNRAEARAFGPESGRGVHGVRDLRQTSAGAVQLRHAWPCSMEKMATHGRWTLALGAAAALVATPGVVASSYAQSRAAAGTNVPATAGAAHPAAAPALAVRDRQLLVRPRGGALQRITVKAGLDPVEIARRLRTRPDLFDSAGANLIARAAGGATLAPASAPASAAQATTPVATTPPGTTPVVPPQPAAGADTPAAGLKGFVPNDHIDDVPWTALQWNFVGPWGVRASQAWAELRDRGASAEGGRGVRVAVIDSGIAYRSRAGYVPSPDLPAGRILQGYDFVDEDRYPDDLSGHGTHVSSTIAGATNNDAGLTGLAYEAEILPIRVLDEDDEGDVVAIARGIRYAARRGVDIINLSVDFPVSATAADIPEVMDAIDLARKRGILVIASSGNDGTGEVALPARSSSVLAVGATTARGCRSTFSNSGAALDLVAPGGGTDHRSERDARCRPGEVGPPIAQVTLLRAGDPSVLGVPLDYVGTSMAAAHVTGIAALVRSSRVLGKDPSPDLLAAYLVRSTRDLGRRGRDDRYGAGLLDASSAVNRRTGKAAVRGAKRAAARASRAGTALPVR